MMRYGEVVWALSTDLVTEEKRSKVPHIYVILLMMIGLAAVLTHIIPAGEYARVTDDSGAEILQDGTYSQISSSPASFFDFMFAVPDGLIDTADIVIGIIIIGGMFAVIEKAGLIELAVSRLAHVFEDKGLWIIPTLMVPFALFTAFTDQIELALVYLPAILPLILRLGFDRITATGIVLVSTVVGFGLGADVTRQRGYGAAHRATAPLFGDRLQSTPAGDLSLRRDRFRLAPCFPGAVQPGHQLQIRHSECNDGIHRSQPDDPESIATADCSLDRSARCLRFPDLLVAGIRLVLP